MHIWNCLVHNKWYYGTEIVRSRGSGNYLTAAFALDYSLLPLPTLGGWRWVDTQSMESRTQTQGAGEKGHCRLLWILLQAPLKHSIHSPLLSKMHGLIFVIVITWVYVYSHILQNILLCPQNVTHMYVFRATHVILNKQTLRYSLEKTISCILSICLQFFVYSWSITAFSLFT